jgi:hypothetical protein
MESEDEGTQSTTDTEVQTEMTCSHVCGLQKELYVIYEENRVLKVQLQSFQPFTEVSMQDAECAQFYTGLPSFLVFIHGI